MSFHYSNRGPYIFMLIIAGLMMPGLSTFLMFFVNSTNVWIFVLLFVFSWLLYHNIITENLVTFDIEDEIITIQKPLRKFGFFRKKANRQIVLSTNDWDELRIKVIKNSKAFYFLKENQLTVFFAVAGFDILGEKLKGIYPDKKIFIDQYYDPIDELNKLKQGHPERVLL